MIRHWATTSSDRLIPKVKMIWSEKILYVLPQVIWFRPCKNSAYFRESSVTFDRFVNWDIRGFTRKSWIWKGGFQRWWIHIWRAYIEEMCIWKCNSYLHACMVTWIDGLVCECAASKMSTCCPMYVHKEYEQKSKLYTGFHNQTAYKDIFWCV